MPNLCRDPIAALLYASLHRGNAGDIAFYERACRGARSVLELGTGYGRVAMALSQSANVVGLDIDPLLLELAEAHARDTAENPPHFVCGDMTDFELEQRFERVIIPHSGLLCLTDLESAARCLACARRHLTEGGQLAFDAYAADAFHAESEPSDMDEDELEPLVSVSLGEDLWDVSEKSRWDKPKQLLHVTYVCRARGSGEERCLELPQRYLLSSEVSPLLARAGLRLRSLFGSFSGEELTGESDVLVVIAEAD
jgi:SAM-dependent methyltransferase